jgi:hypothetical protein
VIKDKYLETLAHENIFVCRMVLRINDDFFLILILILALHSWATGISVMLN